MHAAVSDLTEQPSFYMILCGGREGENKVGTDKCIYRAPNAVVIPGQGAGA